MAHVAGGAAGDGKRRRISWQADSHPEINGIQQTLAVYPELALRYLARGSIIDNPQVER